MKNAQYIGRSVHRLDASPSTNAAAIAYAAKTLPPEGTLFITDRQTAGRGQFGRSWHSSPGHNFTGTYLLYPQHLRSTEAFILSQVLALAVRDTAQYYIRPTVQVKWPNDIYVEGRKLAGLLLQLQWQGGQVRFAVLGVGLNVNELHFPESLPLAVSLRQHTRHLVNLRDVEKQLNRHLEYYYELWKAGQQEQIRALYHEHLLGRGEVQTFERISGGQFSGRVIGVNEQGQLGVESLEGTVWHALHQIRWLWDS